MDLETVSAEAFGKSLRGLGLNLLVRDVPAYCQMLEAVFDMTAHRISADFAIVRYGTAVFQLHSDGTYHANPYLSFLPEAGPRGAGAELRLYDSDPDLAANRATAQGMTILQPPGDKPHGLRECYLICPDGYAWVPSRPL
ncbi:glyoxalase [Mameliella sediminis]|uniref:glyoxalase n=1 Tax=Mameliella sediminis TaxID=2836866 RepID=UPI001C48F205|nr:glyoxalase [Mameliella sediminis]MBV7396211.1 glyoxalase [Mameliella sediminis]